MSENKYTMSPFDAPREEPKPAETPAPSTPAQTAPEAAPETPYLLGRKATDYDAPERGYINERMKEYLEILKKNPATRVFVKDIIHTDIELQRHDRMVEAEKKKYKAKPTDDHTQWLLKMDKVRRGIMDKHVEALKSIGALPKDTMQEVQKDESLADVHVRYLQEISDRKKRGQAIGEPSEEAKDLAVRVGLDPARYRSEDVIPAADRDAIVEESGRGE